MVTAQVIKLGSPRRLAGGDLLGVLQGAAVQQVGGDAGSAECVVAKSGGPASVPRTAPNHLSWC